MEELQETKDDNLRTIFKSFIEDIQNNGIRKSECEVEYLSDDIVRFFNDKDELYEHLIFKLLLMEERVNIVFSAIEKEKTWIESIRTKVQSNTEEILSKADTDRIERWYQFVSGTEKEEPKNIRLNDLGLPMHLLEIEVADLVKRAKNGEKQIFPKYERASDGDPIAYLKKHYGKYLKAFGADDDYLYLDTLNAIDKTFRNTLASYICRTNQNGIIPTKSKRIDKELDVIKGSGMETLLSDSERKKQNRINSVLSTSSHKKRVAAKVVT